ncbi:MAG: hypothetical protein EA360_07195 [Balneolaceae bacterium]|nr:MAG: hypothetical protein EA360_07195 [Balneolaceae bacterium]
MRRFIRFHGMKHPKQMGEREIIDFLNDLADTKNVAASAQQRWSRCEKSARPVSPWLDT